jgi:UPF0755 protein
MVTRVEIVSGQSVRDIAESVKEAEVVRSELLLYAALTYFHDPTNIYAGTYVFTGEQNLFAVADTLASNKIETNLTRLTIPEGMRLTKAAEIAATVLPDFNEADYIEAANELEGKLFPDTYFVPENFSAADLVRLQQNTYQEKLTELQSDFEKSDLTEDEVIILASILEREANDETSMKMVSGILQNRLEIDMALQADATIEYALSVELNELPAGQLATELRETDSPYNTYLNRGLPPTPIGNPGLTAIEAVLNPTASEYFYYITDSDGEFYYARTYQEPLINIEQQ